MNNEFQIMNLRTQECTKISLKSKIYNPCGYLAEYICQKQRLIEAISLIYTVDSP